MSEEKRYIGVDISKEHLDIAVTGDGRKWQVGNNAAGIQKAVKKIKTKKPVLVVFKATRGRELDLWNALTEAGIEAAPVNPRRIRNFAKAMVIVAKTDTKDARVLAEYGQAMNPSVLAFPDTRELKELIARRNQISVMITSEKNRIQATRGAQIRKNIMINIRWLKKLLADIEGEINERIKENAE